MRCATREPDCIMAFVPVDEHRGALGQGSEGRRGSIEVMSSSINDIIRRSSTKNPAAFSRIVRPVKETFEIETRDTLARKLMGSKAGRMCFAAARNPLMPLLLLLAWTLGAGLVSANLFGAVGRTAGVVGAFLTQPAMVFFAALMNVKILRELCSTFQVAFTLGNVAAMVAFLAIALGDGRALSLSLISSSLAVSSFTDALPAFCRYWGNLVFYTMNACGLILLQCMIVFGLGNLQERSFKLASREFAALSFASTANMNLLVLAARNFYTLFRHPRCFVLIQSRLENIKVRAAEAKLEVAVQRNTRDSWRKKSGAVQPL